MHIELSEFWKVSLTASILGAKLRTEHALEEPRKKYEEGAED
jgi:hypothetical protein